MLCSMCSPRGVSVDKLCPTCHSCIHICRGANSNPCTREPKVGKPIRIYEMVIIPTYVRLSEAPLPDGSCVTGPLIDHPAGWYIEYRVAGDNEDHRSFHAFDEVRPV